MKTKWERALTACNEALDWALTQGNRKLFDLATSTSIRINQGVPLPNIEGVDDQFKESVMLMRYLNTTRETDGNKEVIFAIGSGDNYGIYSQNTSWRHHLQRLSCRRMGRYCCFLELC